MVELRSKQTAGTKFNIEQCCTIATAFLLELRRSVCVCVEGQAVGRPCSVRVQFNPPVQQAGDNHPADLKFRKWRVKESLMVSAGAESREFASHTGGRRGAEVRGDRVRAGRRKSGPGGMCRCHEPSSRYCGNV